MNEEIIHWSDYDWLPRERWGSIHEDKQECWYDPEAVKIDPITDQLILKTHYNPHYFEHLDVTSNIGIGLVSLQARFKYGYFEIEAKLPRGKNLWPAFWMWSWDTWPPEIDIFEGYTRKTDNYFTFDIRNPFGFWNVNTNVHTGYYPNNYNLKAKTHWMGFKDPSKHFMKYGCNWTEKSLDLYYNGRKVRSITDKDCLTQLNNTTMNVIINNSVDRDVDIIDPPKSEFIINYFKYKPLIKQQ